MNLEKILSIPRSLLWNVRWFGFRGGVKIPILISNHTKLRKISKGSIKILNPVKFGIQYGFGGSEGIMENRYSFLKTAGGILTFEGTARICAGSSIRIDSGELFIGEHFICNKNCFISCSTGISIGHHVLFGWNVNIRDTDGHTIYINNIERTAAKKVIIGNHVWVASYVDILKGSFIANESVVGYGSCVKSGISGEEHVLLMGNPAKIVKNNIDWKY